MTGRLLGVAAVLMAAILWGTTGTFQSVLPESREPLVVAAARLTIGAAFLLGLAMLRQSDRRGLRAVPLFRAVAAGLAIGLYNLLFFAAVLRAGVGVGTAITIGSAPVWVALYDLAVRRQMPQGLRLFAQALAIAGLALLVWSGTGDEAAAGPGIALAAGAGLAYAAYSLITSSMAGRAPSTSIAAATFAIAALAVAPVFLVVPVSWVVDAQAWPVLLALGVLSTGVAYQLYTWGLGRVAAATAVTLALAEPLTAWILATIVVGEPLTLVKLAGAACLFLGLAIVSLAPARDVPAHRGK